MPGANRSRRHNPLNLVTRAAIGHAFAAYGASIGKRGRETVQELVNAHGTNILYNAFAYASYTGQKSLTLDIMKEGIRAAANPHLNPLPAFTTVLPRGTSAGALKRGVIAVEG